MYSEYDKSLSGHSFLFTNKKLDPNLLRELSYLALIRYHSFLYQY